MLTPKQKNLLAFIHRCLTEHGVPPSFDEMKTAMGLRSKSGIHRLIQALEDRGFVRRLPHKARALEILKVPDGFPAASAIQTEADMNMEIPFVGTIAAGLPTEAVPDETAAISVPSALLGHGTHYALSVDGTSMINAGILENDTVIVKKTATAENGDIVVALIDGSEATLKTFQHRGSSIALVPANPAYSTRLLSSERVAVQGKVVSLLRQY